jgi:hypothetical protein
MHLLPKPKSLNITEGFYTLNYSGQIRLDDSCLKAIKESKRYASLLKEEIKERTGCDYSITTTTVLSAATKHRERRQVSAVALCIYPVTVTNENIHRSFYCHTKAHK